MGSLSKTVYVSRIAQKNKRKHIKHMKRWAIRPIYGEVIFLEGHIKQVDIGHGIGHTLNPTKDVIITGVNNDKIKFE